MLFSVCLFSQEVFDKIVPGKYGVGFKTVTVYDSSRPSIEEQRVKGNGRVIQINVWYPAVTNIAPKINFNEYVQLIANEVDPSTKREGFAIDTYYDWTFQNNSPSGEMLEFKKKGLKMIASLAPKPYDAIFPAVLLIHGGAADFAFLGEFLASHGFVAINVPYKGYLQAELDVDVIGMQTQVKDYEFAVESIKGQMLISSTNLSVIGVSFGGQSAVSFSFKNRVNCIISYDGGIGSEFGASLLQSDPLYRLEKIDVPLLHFYNPNDIYTNLSFIRKYKHSDRTLISMKNMEHAHFWSWGILDRYLPNVINNVRPGNSYEAVLQETLNFLSKYSKQTEMICDWCTGLEYSKEYLNAS
jgi:dienelactone hydrolase